ncbi:hypothetical protein B0I35DRAFT_446133 [Stachybotrys elegans]|uniref:Ecp2 effector protein-like domain-containing protein n=1 Tax=Stachybotrys elegans TaxID=80388 RepID=A0A8K0SBP6_9HYPO|nr:hypothetical protein B0I35DRAFT_446133 [Stachybotrys elegans]
MSTGSCVFGASPYLTFDDSLRSSTIGSEDVHDLVRDSIHLFQRDGKVGSRGEMDCWTEPAWGYYEKAAWGIYHS